MTGPLVRFSNHGRLSGPPPPTGPKQLLAGLVHRHDPRVACDRLHAFGSTPFITGLMLLASTYLLCWDYDVLKNLMRPTPVQSSAD